MLLLELPTLGLPHGLDSISQRLVARFDVTVPVAKPEPDGFNAFLDALFCGFDIED